MRRLLLLFALCPSFAMAQGIQPGLPSLNGPLGAQTPTGPADANTVLGRTLAGYMSDAIDVRTYGAIGDGNSHPLSTVYGTLAKAQAVCPEATSLTQEADWCGIQAAYDHAALSTFGTTVYLPAGRYRLTTPVTATVAGTQAIAMRGDGMTATEVLQTGGTDGFDIALGSVGTWLRDSGGTGPTFSASDMSVVKSSAGVAANGISVTSTYASAGLRQARVNNLAFRGDSAGGAWADGLFMVGTEQPDVNDVYCHASSGGDTASVCVYFAGTATQTIVDLNVNNIRMAGGYAAVQIGPYAQGVYVRRPNATGSQYGVYWAAGTAGAPDSLTVSDGQLNTYLGGIYADSVADVVVHGNYDFPIFGSNSTSVAANVSSGATSFQVASAAGIQAGDNIGITGFPSAARVASVSGTTITSTMAATAGISSGASILFQHSPDWIGGRIGNASRFTVTGNVFNGGGIASQSAVLAVNEAGGAVTGNFSYLFPSSQGALQLTGTTGNVGVTGNSCMTCGAVGYDSNSKATGNFATSNLLNGFLILSGYTTANVLALSNGINFVGDGSGFVVQNGLGYAFHTWGPASGAIAVRPTVTAANAGSPALFSCDSTPGGVLAAANPNNCAVQFTGNGTGLTQLGSPTSPTKLPVYTVATLPACNAAYQDALAIVSDASSPSYRGTLTGGSNSHTLVECDGTSWLAH